SVETSAQFGGMLCHGPLKEVRTCSGKAEQSVLQKPCKLDEWSIWAPCANNVQQRTRQVEEDAGPEGEPCSGVVREVRSCQEPIDCKVSAWTAWDACDRDCGVGQSQRHRQVTQNPMYHGQPCPISLVEAKSCIVKTCKAEDAQVGAWTSWSSCTSSCGIGHKVRERQVTSSQEGAGFSGALKEASSCGEVSHSKACEEKVDCAWADWSAWGSCSASCGFGSRTRNRHIAQHPSQDGEPCQPQPTAEVEACLEGHCQGSCKDGEWGDWTEWSSCSQSCAGGVAERSREAAHVASPCGNPALGPQKEQASCNENVPCIATLDCEFNDWSAWGACSAECDGTQSRERGIEHYGSGDGAFCQGSVHETQPCQAAGVQCESEPVDCVLGEWTNWSPCDKACGRGEKTRSRELVTEPRAGGKECEGGLKELATCLAKRCEDECVPTDCVWGEWSQWSYCSTCSEDRVRARVIAVHPACGGSVCQPHATEEMRSLEAPWDQTKGLEKNRGTGFPQIA
ncbi:unnamed protein product, partial [Effrenium voratum]